MIDAERQKLRHARRQSHLAAISTGRVLELCLAVEELLDLKPEEWTTRKDWREAVRALRVDFEPFTAERQKWADESRVPSAAPAASPLSDTLLRMETKAAGRRTRR